MVMDFAMFFTLDESQSLRNILFRFFLCYGYYRGTNVKKFLTFFNIFQQITFKTVAKEKTEQNTFHYFVFFQ